MADDINLPNLVSHLQVNLDGVSGAIADAQRQGSSMGAALGRGVNRELDSVLRHLPQVRIDGNSDPLDRDLARIHRELAQLDSQRIGIDIAVPDALRQIEQLQAHLQRLGDEHPNVNVQASTRQAARQLDELLAAARRVDDEDVTVDVHVDEDHINRLHGLLGKLTGALSSLGGFGATFGKVAAGIGTIVPAAAGVVTTLEQVAPAAGVAVTGLAAVQLASGAVKLAAVGMEDALSAALDPSKADKFDEALKKLSPNAREFARTVRDMGPALREVQQSVQDRVFKGLADQLERTGKSVLPVLRTNLLSAGGALHDMASGVLSAGKELADSGTLGKALGSASKGLHNLSGIPKVVVTSLGQIAAAAGPSFERLTAAAAKGAKGIGDKLSAAFKSGAMQKAIEHALDLLGQLMDVGGNVVKIIGNIFGAVPAGGGGLIGILKDITGELAKITASKEVQSGLRSLFSVMGTLGKTVAPLLGQALAAIAPVITALGPPVETLIRSLGAGLSPIIVALGPVLQAAARAVGALIVAVSPLLPVIGQLIAALLPALTPLLDACTQVFEALAPVVAQVATTLQQTLSPILAQLPGIIAPLAQILAEQLVYGLQILGQVLTACGPSLITLGQAFAQVLVAVSPLLTVLAQLTAAFFTGLMPVMVPLIALVGKLATILATGLAAILTGVVVPAVEIVTALLRGDFSGAWNIATTAVNRAVQTVAVATVRLGVVVSQGVDQAIAWLRGMPGRAAAALAPLIGAIAAVASSAGSQMVSAISGRISAAIAIVRGLPGRARAALGNLGSYLFGAGASLINGFVSGIISKIPSIESVLGRITSMIPEKKGPPSKDAKLLTPAGRLLIEGFIRGIDESTAKLRARLESITKALPANVRSGIGRTLARATAELEKQVTRRDAVLKKLSAAQKNLDDLVKARNKAASDITEGILKDANITTGHADVNSVSAITVGLQQALKKAQEFQANIAKLRKAGIRSDLLQQIADAGVDAGGATAAALAKATPAELKRINDLQAQLVKSATATGNTVGDALYGAGIKAAQGLVAGLKSQEKAIEKLMREIAENMLKTVKKAHKTHSPSRAFHEIGVMDGEGLRGGLLAMAAKVRAAAQRVAGAALDVATGSPNFAVPSGAQLATAYAGTGVTTGGDNHFHLYGGDATPGGILRALSWQGLVGGR
ncbi:hypothetical protein ACFW08_20285 [Streptomyces sp. NPDC058960]|uniref:hypothetical protein n=1 Tax=Streptomyces sp. NPDC058960 TaxID=3346679 RepID=UPI0036C54842